MKKVLKNQKGLTLVELLAVIVILGIIAAIAVPAIANIIDNSRKDAHVANAEALYDAARLAIVAENISASEDNEWTFDAIEEEDESEDTTINLVVDGYLDNPPEDPEGDGTYDNAQVVYNGDTYNITLDDYFADDATITEIRSAGRDSVQ